MNIPGLHILNSGHSCSCTNLDHRRQLGYFQNEVTRNSADHKVGEKTNTTQNAVWTKHKMFHSSFTLLRWVPKCQLVAAGQKEETYFYTMPSVCIHNIHKHKNIVSKEVIGPWLKTLPCLWVYHEEVKLFTLWSPGITPLYTPTTSDSLLCNFWMSYCAFSSFPVINWLSLHGWFLSEVNWWGAREYFPYWDSLPLSGFPSFDIFLQHGIGEPYMKSRTLISSSAKRNKY